MRRTTLVMVFICLMMTGCVTTTSREDLATKARNQIGHTVAEWHYAGTKDGYHYFYSSGIHFAGGWYRVSSDSLSINYEMPYTRDRKKWLLTPWGAPHPRSQPVRDFATPPLYYLSIQPSANFTILPPVTRIEQVDDGNAEKPPGVEREP